MTHIIGAGLSGLITAHVLPGAMVYERNPRGQMHNALLRFRSDKVAKATGIGFKKVQVRKGIWYHGEVQPSIRICNMYSQKVTGTIGDRSIWNLDPVERFIAPPDFYAQMVENLEAQDRIRFETPVDLGDYVQRDHAPNCISTMPLPALLDILQVDRTGIEFTHAPIYTMQVVLDDVDAYQTVYLPTPAHGLYRASITGSTLILEFTDDVHREDYWIDDVLGAFNLSQCYGIRIRNLLVDQECDGDIIRTQQYGKIIPLADPVRRSLLLYISAQFNIYSIGRFATWRNILLDDVVQDAHRVRDMMLADSYESKLIRSEHARPTH